MSVGDRDTALEYLAGLSADERSRLFRAAETGDRDAEVAGAPSEAGDGDVDDVEWQPFQNAAHIDASAPLPKVVLPALAWRERLSLIAGDAKAGKSTVLAQALEAALTGRSFGGQQIDGDLGAVAIITEEPVGLLAARLLFYGLTETGDHMERIWIASPRLGAGRILAALERQSPDLVVFDSFTDWAVGGAGAESLNDAAGMRRCMAALREVADRGAAVLVVHHARKADGAVRDSSDLAAAVDMIVMFEPVDLEGERCVMGSSDRRRLNYLGRWPVDTVPLDFDRATRRYLVVQGGEDGEKHEPAPEDDPHAIRR